MCFLGWNLSHWISLLQLFDSVITIQVVDPKTDALFDSMKKDSTAEIVFAFTSRFLYLGNMLRGLARGVLALRNLRAMTSRLMPTLCSPPPTHLLEAPIVPLSPPLVLPSSIPTLGYQSSLVTVTPNRLPDLVPLLLLLAFFSGFVLLLPGLVYVYSAIANRISASAYSSRKISKAYSFNPIFSLVPAFSLKPVFRLVPYFFPTQIFSRRQSPPAEPKQEQTRTPTSYLVEIQHQYREQELLASLAQHKLELEEEKQHRLRTQRIYSEFVDSQNSLRRQVEVSRTREGELQADLRAAEAERRELKDLIATLEASDAAFRAELTACR
ncbi:hypothetical protein EDB87DRAFT_1680146 [Lactarius vividus]|nr:hypothetical protein EDB87DRAFT_1680146 [Lactarius vividus]